MESMTGFGSARAELNGCVLTASARSVNHRGLSVHLRFPREAASLEQEAHGMITEGFRRGRIELTVSVETGGADGTAPETDMDMAAAYVRAAAAMGREFGLEPGITAFGLMGMPGVLRVPGPSDPGDLAPVLPGVIGEALAALKESRLREGEGLRCVFRDGLSSLMEQTGPMASGHGQRVQAAFEKYRKRIGELLADAEMDQARLVQEIAVMADRLDISEECQRLVHHAREAMAVLDEPACGMKLGFLVQEMHRELNTMGAKVTDPEAVHCVIRMKELVGGMKEQAANVQ